MSGWTPVHDRMFDPEHELAGEPVCKRWAWIDLVHMARKYPGNRVIKMTPIPLERGEFIVSVRFLAERWRWSRGATTRFLDLLRSDAVSKLETVRGTPHGTVYRVASYETYALSGDTKRDTKRDASGTGAGRERDKEVDVKGKKGKKRAKPKVALPDEWEPLERHREKAVEFQVDVDGEVEAFRNHHLSKGNRYVDWDRAFDTWLGNTQKWGPNAPRKKQGQKRDRGLRASPDAIRKHNERMQGNVIPFPTEAEA